MGARCHRRIENSDGEYLPSGRSAFRTSERNRYRFIGVERDVDTGLCMTGPRTYDPLLGRFLQPDPLVQPGEGPFVYASGNPVGRLDPGGYDDSAFTDEQKAALDGIEQLYFLPEFDVPKPTLKPGQKTDVLAAWRREKETYDAKRAQLREVGEQLSTVARAGFRSANKGYGDSVRQALSAAADFVGSALSLFGAVSGPGGKNGNSDTPHEGEFFYKVG